MSDDFEKLMTDAAASAGNAGTKPDDFESLMSDAATMASKKQAQPPTKPEEAPHGFLQEMGNRTVGILDTALGLPGQALSSAVYAGARAGGATPENAQIYGQAAAETFALDHPLARLVNLIKGGDVTQTSGYNAQNPITATAGNIFNAATQKAAQVTGMPQQDVQNIASGALAMLPFKQSGALATDEAAKVAWNAAQKTPNEMATGAPVKTQFAPGGSAGATVAEQAESAGASRDLVSAIKDAEKSGNVDYKTAEMHIKADTLPVPMQLTKGMASGDPVTISEEMNSKGTNPEMVNRINTLNNQLKENLNAIRDNAAPDVFDADHVESGRSLISAYKQMDSVLRDEISNKYKVLADQNGGTIPLDGQQFVAQANAELGKQMKGAFVPPQIQSIMADVLSGKQPMTFENYENLKTILASAQRQAEKSGDGNVSGAVGIIRNALEDLPMPQGAENLQQLANDARGAARARFKLLENDPAYKAAVNDSVAPDDFIDKFIVRGKADKVATMAQNLADDPNALQTMRLGVLNALKKSSGVSSEKNNFSQSGYNRMFSALDQGGKLDSLFRSDDLTNLRNLGDVARATQLQPSGSYVNNSNTWVSAAGSLVNKGMGAYVPGYKAFIQPKISNIIETQKMKPNLEVGAGIKK